MGAVCKPALASVGEAGAETVGEDVAVVEGAASLGRFALRRSSHVTLRFFEFDVPGNVDADEGPFDDSVTFVEMRLRTGACEDEVGVVSAVEPGVAC